MNISWIFNWNPSTYFQLFSTPNFPADSPSVATPIVAIDYLDLPSSTSPTGEEGRTNRISLTLNRSQGYIQIRPTVILPRLPRLESKLGQSSHKLRLQSRQKNLRTDFVRWSLPQIRRCCQTPPDFSTNLRMWVVTHVQWSQSHRSFIFRSPRQIIWRRIDIIVKQALTFIWYSITQ